MTASDAIGYLASALVLVAFCMREMVPLRVVAVCSNIVFLIYGAALGLTPVWLLHTVLLPINCWRLWEGMSQTPFGRSRLFLPSFAALAARLLSGRAFSDPSTFAASKFKCGTPLAMNARRQRAARSS
jgi:hypothetical protein